MSEQCCKILNSCNKYIPVKSQDSSFGSLNISEKEYEDYPFEFKISGFSWELSINSTNTWH